MLGGTYSPCSSSVVVPALEGQAHRPRSTWGSVTALTTLINLKADGRTALFARELALDVAKVLYEPQGAAHIPGATHTIADFLSRMGGGRTGLPSALRHARLRSVPARDRTWWRTI